MNSRYILFAFGLFFFLQACAGPQKPPENLLSLTEAQMKLRSYQTRTFDAKDTVEVLKAVAAALQDLGFIIERANAPMGLITAGKFAGEGFVGFVEVTVMVRTAGTKQVEVRVNALYNTKPIEDPKVYGNFFATLEKSLFVSHSVGNN